MTELTQELVKSLFDYRDGTLYWKKIDGKSNRKIGDIAGSLIKSSGYYRIKINQKSYLTHRLIFLYHEGYLPKMIDHIDRNRNNNQIENLREVTNSQNLVNSIKRKNSSSIYKGVTWDKSRNKWFVRITFNKKSFNLGRFKSEKDAAKTYNKAAIELFGEYAMLNEVK